MTSQNGLLIYTLSKAIAATKVDYERLAHLKADLYLVRDSGRQELNEWKDHNLEEFCNLSYKANNHTSNTEARKALRHLCVKTEYLTSQDSDIQTLLEYANKILSE